MKGKVLLLVLVIAFLGIIMIGGCGETTHSSSSYYYPNWLPDGRIICCKVVSRWSDALWGRRELGDRNYITAMNSDGSNETDLFEVEGLVKEITCSPTGELIGYIAYPYKLTITDYQGSNKTVVPNVAYGVSYFDWSPDAKKIAYSASSDLYVINVDGTNNTKIATSAAEVAWRVGEKIAYLYADSESSKIFLINSDGSNGEIFVSIGFNSQKTNDNSIVYDGGIPIRVRQKNIEGLSEVVLFDDYERSTLKLSFDNSKIVGGDLITGGGSWIGGIWVVNIDGTGEKRLR